MKNTEIVQISELSGPFHRSVRVFLRNNMRNCPKCPLTMETTGDVQRWDDDSASKARRELPFRLRNCQKVSNDQPSGLCLPVAGRSFARVCACRYAAARERERIIARGSPLNRSQYTRFPRIPAS